MKKTVILGVTGSIAAYKTADIASALAKNNYDVHVIMTENATEIITPLTFSTLTGNKTIVNTFDKNVNYNVAHVSLAKKADLFMIVPATANVIAKCAYGLADDMLTTTALACTCPKIIAPAMNTAMYNNPIVQKNLQILSDAGFIIVEPDSGILACKDEGKGKLPPMSVLLDYIEKYSADKKDLSGQKILITAGPTRESIDPVRYISNHSTGKMGYALARSAMLRGADVTLISGPTDLSPVPFVKNISIASAEEMFEAVKQIADEQDIIIKSAAVADYSPTTVADQKIKKSDGEMTIALRRTQDILQYLGEHRRSGQFICGFSMETENLIENSRKKLIKKNVDMIAANNVKVAGAGFATDTNIVTLITADQILELPLMNKSEVADRIFDHILNIQKHSCE